MSLGVIPRNRLIIYSILVVVLLVFAFVHKSNSARVKGLDVDTNNVLATYTPSKHTGQPIYFDGGAGVDTLKLRMTQKEYMHPEFLGDMIRFNYYLMKNIDPQNSSGQGARFKFQSLRLSISNFEILKIERIQ